MPTFDQALVRRLHNDLRDDLDEELELEIEVRRVEELGIEQGDADLLSIERREDYTRPPLPSSMFVPEVY